MSRSEFFARAAQRYLEELDAQSLTHEIDSALDSLREGDDSGAAAIGVGRRLMAGTADEW